VIPQHQLLRVPIQAHLLEHPARNQIAVQVMLEPVRSYVRGTISGTSSWRYSSMRPRSSNLPQASLIFAGRCFFRHPIRCWTTSFMGALAYKTGHKRQKLQSLTTRILV
jgi:hypothetical protein